MQSAGLSNFYRFDLVDNVARKYRRLHDNFEVFLSAVPFVKTSFIAISEIRGGFDRKLPNFDGETESGLRMIVEDNDQISQQRFEAFFSVFR